MITPGAFADVAGPALTVLLGGLAPLLGLPLAILAFGRFAADIAAPAITMIEWLSAVAERLAQIFLALLALLVGLVVVLRYGFGVSSNLLAEGALYAHAFAFLLASAAALGRDGHVRVDVFYAHLGATQKASVNLFAYFAFAAPMLVAILHFSGSFVADAWRIGERSREPDGLHLVFVLKTAIPVFAVLLLAQALAEACRNACIVRRLEPATKRFAHDDVSPG